MQVDKSVFNLFNSLAFLALGWLLASFASRLAGVARPRPFILVSSYLYYGGAYQNLAKQPSGYLAPSIISGPPSFISPGFMPFYFGNPVSKQACL